MKQDRKICVGVIMGAHGVRGQVRLRSFTEDPEDIASYGALTDESGQRKFNIKLKGTMKDHFIGTLSDVNDRNAAEALRGAKLFVERAALPKTRKREYYEADLIGLAAKDKAGKSCGKVTGVHDYGGGPFLEIDPGKGGSFMLPFTEACVPDVDIEAGSVVIELPEGWLDKAKPGDDKP